MTTILIERSTVEQALEALETPIHEQSFMQKQNAITALKAALAEPQEPDSPERRCGGPGCDMTCCQPVQEPLGYLWPTGRHPEFRYTQQKIDGVDGTPVYTTPPQRKPLTEEEIQAAWDSVDMRHPRGNETRIAFARAIERAHGIGGEG